MIRRATLFSTNLCVKSLHGRAKKRDKNCGKAQICRHPQQKDRFPLLRPSSPAYNTGEMRVCAALFLCQLLNANGPDASAKRGGGKEEKKRCHSKTNEVTNAGDHGSTKHVLPLQVRSGTLSPRGVMIRRTTLFGTKNRKTERSTCNLLVASWWSTSFGLVHEGRRKTAGAVVRLCGVQKANDRRGANGSRQKRSWWSSRRTSLCALQTTSARTVTPATSCPRDVPQARRCPQRDAPPIPTYYTTRIPPQAKSLRNIPSVGPESKFARHFLYLRHSEHVGREQGERKHSDRVADVREFSSREDGGFAELNHVRQLGPGDPLAVPERKARTQSCSPAWVRGPACST